MIKKCNSLGTSAVNDNNESTLGYPVRHSVIQIQIPCLKKSSLSLNF